MPASNQQRSKIHPEFKQNAHRCWIEKWDVRMASRYTIVEVRCSTDPQPEDEPLHTYKRHEPEATAWEAVVEHMEFLRAMGRLQPGKWCITLPGTDRRHSFEVT